MLYSHSIGFAVIRYLHLFVFFPKKNYIRILLVSHYVGFAVIRYLHLFVFFPKKNYIRILLVSHSVGFAVIRSSHLLVFRNDSQACYIRIPLVFALIRYSHLFVFRDYSQSCYIRIPLVSLRFAICIYSFFAMIRSHVIFAFRWFRIDSLFASIRFSQ